MKRVSPAWWPSCDCSAQLSVAVPGRRLYRIHRSASGCCFCVLTDQRAAPQLLIPGALLCASAVRGPQSVCRLPGQAREGRSGLQTCLVAALPASPRLAPTHAPAGPVGPPAAIIELWRRSLMPDCVGLWIPTLRWPCLHRPPMLCHCCQPAHAMLVKAGCERWTLAHVRHACRAAPLAPHACSVSCLASLAVSGMESAAGRSAAQKQQKAADGVAPGTHAALRVAAIVRPSLVLTLFSWALPAVAPLRARRTQRRPGKKQAATCHSGLLWDLS